MNDQDRARLAAQLQQGDSLAVTLGIELRALGKGSARVVMRVRPDMANGQGICHGGMIFSLADTGFGFACNSNNIPSLAYACAINYLKPGILGEMLTAEVTQTARSGRTGIYDATVTGEDGRLIATFRGTSRSNPKERVIADIEAD